MSCAFLSKQPRFGLAGVLAWGPALMCGDDCRGIVGFHGLLSVIGRGAPGHIQATQE